MKPEVNTEDMKRIRSRGDGSDRLDGGQPAGVTRSGERESNRRAEA